MKQSPCSSMSLPLLSQALSRVMSPSTDFACTGCLMAPSCPAVVAAVWAMPVCGLLISLSIVQERLNQASAPRNTPQPSTPPPPMRSPPLLQHPPSIKDLVRRSDCLMGAFKSEKGLSRDYSGVSPPPPPDPAGAEEDELWSADREPAPACSD